MNKSSYLGVFGLIHFEQWLFRALVLDCGWWCYYSKEYYTVMLLGESCTVILSGDFFGGGDGIHLTTFELGDNY